MNQNTKQLLYRISNTPVKNSVKFTLFNHKTKNPYQKDWNTDDKLHFNINQIQSELTANTNKNIGVLGGRGILIIDLDIPKNTKSNEYLDIDFKDNFLFQFMSETIKKTLITSTGKGLHFIYWYDEDLPTDTINLVHEGVDYGEFRNSLTHHTVEAGSIHPNNKEYQIHNDHPISKFDSKDFEQLKNFFFDTWKTPKKKKEQTLQNFNEIHEDDLVNHRYSIEFDKLLQLTNLNKSDFMLKNEDNEEYLQYKGEHITHGSTSGHNMIIKWFPKDKHVSWQCFRHETTDKTLRNGLTLHAMMNGICDCEDTVNIKENTSIIEDTIKHINTSKINDITQEPIISKKVSNIESDTPEHSDFMYIDYIKQDPIHDFLDKYSLYQRIHNKKSKYVKEYSNYEAHCLKIISHFEKNVSKNIIKEIIKYSSLKSTSIFYEDKQKGYVVSYYNIISQFIYDFAPDNYTEFVEEYAKQSNEQSLSVDFNVILDHYRGSKYTDYILNLSKWENTEEVLFKSHDFNEILTKEVYQKYLINNFLAENSLKLISSSPKVGKTFLALQLQMCLATGRDFFGLKTEKVSTCFFDLENSDIVMYPRYKGMIKGFAFTPEEMQDLSQNIHLQTKQEGWGFVYTENNELKLNESLLNKSIKFCIDKNVKVAIFDPLVNIGQFSETNEDFVFIKQKVFDKFLKNGIALIVLHHQTKGKDKQGNGSARGGGSLEGFVNTSYSLYKNGEDNVKLQAVYTRSGEIPCIEYNIDIKEEQRGDNTKEYKHIKLTKIERKQGLLPEQIEVLDILEKKEFFTTTDFTSLCFESGLIEKNDKKLTTPSQPATLRKLVKDLLPFVDYISSKGKKRHNFTDSTGKKINQSVFVFKKPKYLEDSDDE